jgi:antitoxin HicB
MGSVENAGYSARITKQRGGGYLVEFPDLPGCLTEGDTLAEALGQAREAMTGWLYAAIKAGEEPPTANEHKGRSFHLIAPQLDVAIPLEIIRARLAKRLTQNQVAERLGISQQAYRKLEVPGKSNPTIKTLARLGEVLGLRVVMSKSDE